MQPGSPWQHAPYTHKHRISRAIFLGATSVILSQRKLFSEGKPDGLNWTGRTTGRRAWKAFIRHNMSICTCRRHARIHHIARGNNKSTKDLAREREARCRGRAGCRRRERKDGLKERTGRSTARSGAGTSTRRSGEEPLCECQVRACPSGDCQAFLHAALFTE